MKISAALTGVSKLCFDTAPLIYFIETHPTYLARMDTIMQRINAGDIAGVTSVITLTEVLTHPLKQGRHDLEQAYRAILLGGRGFSLEPINATVAAHAARLRAQYNLKTPDALQIAVAVETGCEALLTNDLGLVRVQNIRVLVLDQLELD